jgi:hypothetical protein
MMADHERKKALAEAQWDERIRENPNALLDSERKRERDEKIQKRFDDFVENQDDKGMEGSTTGFTPYPPKPSTPAKDLTPEEQEVEAARAAAFAPKSKSGEDTNAAWTEAKKKLDERIGKKEMYNALAAAIEDDGTVNQVKLEEGLMAAFKGPDGKWESPMQIAAKVNRPWAVDTVTFDELIGIRAAELIAERERYSGSVGNSTASRLKGVTAGTPTPAK